MAEAVGRNIVLLSDGTGNSAGKLFKTNVWRIYDALDLSNASQIASYDDGVGTSSIKPLAMLGGAVGWGLKRNVLSLYTFLCLNYKEGDRIYGFGFSRGAFTMRVFISFVLSQGLVADATSSEDLRRKALRLYRKFRIEQTQYYGLHTLARPLRDGLVWLRDVVRGQWRDLRNIATTPVKEIAFLGLWDTVDAYGVPVAELGKGVDQWIWPMSLNDKELDPRIAKACHALSIDDKRTTFHPLLWDETTMECATHTDEERLTQVWFAGAHANVGGGYPDDALSYVPLRWMAGEAAKCGVRFNPLALAAIDVKVSPFGRIYNSRAGLGAYYRYDPRRLDPPRDRQGACIPNPKIHETVLWRMAMGADAYAPLSLPNGVRVVSELRGAKTGAPLGADVLKRPNIMSFDDYRKAVRGDSELYGAPAGDAADPEARNRAAADFDALMMPDERTLDFIWDTVWWRRVAYFVTLLSTALVVLFPWMVDDLTPGEHPVAWAAGVVKGLLPSVAESWIEAFQSHTITFSLLLAATTLFYLWGQLLDRRIQDRAIAAWTGKGRLTRFRAFQSNVRGRVATVLLLLIPGLAAILFIVIAIILTRDTILGVLLGVLGAVILVVELPIAIWWFVLWRIRKKSEASQEELRGPALLVANKLRTSAVTAAPYRFFARHILPTVFAFSLIIAAVYGASRISFAFMESAGVSCDESRYENFTKEPKKTDLNLGVSCQPLGGSVKANESYEIEFQPDGHWTDEGVTTSMIGQATSQLGWKKYFQLPLRRRLGQKWFVPIVRVGHVGREEYVLRSIKTTITPKASGPLFVFVNDAVIGWIDHDRFYKDNAGGGTVTVKRIVDE